MKILVIGATGATGKLVAEELLNRGHMLKVIVRSADRLSEMAKNHGALSIIEGNILDFTNDELQNHLLDCDAVVSCLGHNLTWKGVYGHPRRLVADVAHRICDAIQSNRPTKPVKYVLMNTTGNSNRDLKEPISFGQKCVIGLLRLLLPPHVDNEKAADFFRTSIGQNNAHVEWTAVRPDTLLNEEDVSDYKIYPSPIRSAIFDAGKTSRINVAHFMSDLITDSDKWKLWKGQMPVIYNLEKSKS